MVQEVVKAATNAIAVSKKYTVQSRGVWERLRRVLAVDPNRSTGVPLNPQFRNPPPGALSPLSYDDPVTVPAGDIADNPYWKRDVRRQYPRLSAITQGDVVGLLTVGSKSAPKEEALQIGEAGQKQLATLKEEGQSRGLSVFFEKDKKDISGVLGPNNMPPFPAKLKSSSGYELNSEQTYENKYPCRTFV